jgi:ribonuclease HI
MALKIYQINLQHCKAASTELIKNISLNNIHISLIQEPYILNNKVKLLESKVITLISSNTNNKLRTCILLNHKIEYVLLNEFCDGDVTAIKAKFKGSNEIVIASVYMPHDSAVISVQSNTAKLVNYCKYNNLQLIIGCDSNAHHTVWASSDTNERGELLLEFLMTNNLCILNQGNEPTFVTSNRSEVLDLSFCTQFIESKIANWCVTDEITLSDHRLIYFEIDYNCNYEEYYRNPKKTDWKMYNFNLSEKLMSINSDNILLNKSELDSYAMAINCAIKEAFELSCKEKKRKNNNKCMWYSEKLVALRKRVRKLWNASKKRIKKGEFEHDVVKAYKSNLTHYNNELMKAKKLSWENKCNEIEAFEEAARLVKFLSNGNYKNVNTLKKMDGTFTNSTDESIKLLLNAHFPNCIFLTNESDKFNNVNNIVNTSSYRMTESENNNCDMSSCVNNSSDNLLNNNEYNKSINSNLVTSVDENSTNSSFSVPEANVNALQMNINSLLCKEKIIWAINSFKPFKSPGGDGILPALIQKGLDWLLPHLVVMFRASLELGYVPKSWCETNVVFIPKPGKDSYTETNAFRPISLMSFVLKTLEKLVDLHIKTEIDIDNYLHPYQYAYRAGKSTTTAIHKVVSLMEKSLHEKEYAMLVVLDIDAAFNATIFQVIRNALTRAGAEAWLINWIMAMLADRVICASLFDTKIKIKPTQGTPQGGCLSTLLWSLVVNDLLFELNQIGGVKAVGFADDFCLFVSGKFLSTVLEVMQRGLSVVQKWCERNSLTVNAGKSNAMCVTNKYKVNLTNSLRIFGNEIKYVNSIKYLGIMLDYKLNWNLHVEFTYNKCIKALWACRSIAGKIWGVKPHIMMWIYKQIILPKMTYGALVWAHKCKTNSGLITALAKIQRLSLLCVSGAMRSTSTDSLEAGFALPPLQFVLEEIAKITAIRLCINNDWNISNQHYGHGSLNAFLNLNKSLWQENDLIKRTFSLGKKFNTVVGNGELLITNAQSSTINIFTDAAKNNNGVGIGMYNENSNTKLSLRVNSDSNVLQAEIRAISIGADHALSNKLENKVINFYSDSLWAINCISKITFVSKEALECASKLNEISNFNIVNLIWIKSHSGIRGNEIADELARSATSSNEYLNINKSIEAVKTQCMNNLLLKHKNHWNTSRGSIITKRFIPNVSEKFSLQLLNLKRIEIRTIIGLLTGHCLLKKHGQRLKLYSDSICRLCEEEEEDSIHILCECVALADLRNKFFNQEYVEPENFFKLNFRAIFAFLKESNILALLKQESL